jgi:hypothetical protein
VIPPLCRGADAPLSYKQCSQTQSTPRRDGDAERIGQHCRPCAARPSGERCPAEVLVGQPRLMGSRIDSVFSVTPLCRCRSVHHAGPPLTAPCSLLPAPCTPPPAPRVRKENIFSPKPGTHPKFSRQENIFRRLAPPLPGRFQSEISRGAARKCVARTGAKPVAFCPQKKSRNFCLARWISI